MVKAPPTGSFLNGPDGRKMERDHTIGPVAGETGYVSHEYYNHDKVSKQATINFFRIESMQRHRFFRRKLHVENFFRRKITSADECNERVFKFFHQICVVENCFGRKLTLVEKNFDEKNF